MIGIIPGLPRLTSTPKARATTESLHHKSHDRQKGSYRGYTSMRVVGAGEYT